MSNEEKRDLVHPELRHFFAFAEESKNIDCMGKMENLDQKEGKPAGDRGRRKPAPVKRINLTVRGEPALWLEEWIERGLCNSVADAVLFSLQTFHERITNHDTKEEQLKMLRQLRPRNAEVREEV